MSENLAGRWMRRYKLYFLLLLVILGVQMFLAYKSLGITNLGTTSSSHALLAQEDLSSSDSPQVVQKQQQSALKTQSQTNAAAVIFSQNSASDDEDPPHSNSVVQEKRDLHGSAVTATANAVLAQQLGFQPECEIEAKEAISALQRAKTKDCRKHIAHVACAIQAGHFYANILPSHCPVGNHTANASLGCYRDEKEFRLLSGYFTNFKTSNTPQKCIELCLQSGFPYAGVQYGTECFCGAEPPTNAAKLADSSCNMKCSGDTKEVCGGYYSVNIYETGIAKFTPKVAETNIKRPGEERIKIAFLLTLNGRAIRQVHRLIKALYTPHHVFYIHVDERQDYLYRKLLELETNFPNIRLSRKRFSTIWGGASLLSMLMQCMQDLLAATEWQWDFVINLSESDFPVKTVDKLVDFLTANRGRNFVKSHGRETQRFIQKQGLDKTFVECDTHMWRIGDRRLPKGIQIDGGSDWIALSRPFVEYVTTDAKADALLAGLLVVFQHTLLPAESFFHTVLRNSRFCDTYVDNNLHVTNWKRKLGCKCQYKHVVDWCGCSPNDFKPEDWTRLQGTEQKLLFFARKFEPIINQAILFQLEEWLFGPYTSDFQNLHSYWQSLYHVEDASTKADDLTRTIGDSLIRIVSHQLQLKSASHLLELTHYMHQDQYKGFLLRFRATFSTPSESTAASSIETCELETRIRPVQYAKVAKNSKFAKRLRNFEVSSDYDQKEQVSRNYAKILGPFTQLVLSFNLLAATTTTHNDGALTAHSYNLTLLWIDPTGNLEDYNELHIEDTPNDAINFSKALLKQPLMPGIWTVKLIGRAGIYAQTKFLISPLAYDAGNPLSKVERAKILNGGGGNGIGQRKHRSTLPIDFELPNEWQPHLPTKEERRLLEQSAQTNSHRIEHKLLAWIDELVVKFFHIRETCAVNEAAMKLSTAAVDTLPLCKNTMWSSLAPDPKSDIRALLKRR